MGKLHHPINIEELDPHYKGIPFPYFQPIISVEDKHIIGYEALARGYDPKGNIVSIGKLFHSDLPVAQLKRLDNYLREESIRRFALSKYKNTRKLFINVLPRWLEDVDPEAALEEVSPFVEMVERYQVPPSSIVLEITEDEFTLRPEYMSRKVEGLKRQGFLIALDDFGAGYSNMSRLGQIKPKYIKLDLHLIRRGFSEAIYKEVLNSLSFLAEKIGAILLVEGIEQVDELYGALDIGARYLQGYFLGLPNDGFEATDDLNHVLHEYVQDFHKRKLSQIQSMLFFKDIVSTYFEKHLQEFFIPIKENDRIKIQPIEPEKFPTYWKERLKKVYFLNADGIQTSPNYELIKKSDGQCIWQEKDNFVGKDWSWRPYFLSFMAYKKVQDKSRSYSDPYRDIHAGELIVTFVHQYNDLALLCLDFEVSHLHDPLWHLHLRESRII